MYNNNRILIIDDDPGIRETYRSILLPAPRKDVMAKGAALFGDDDIKTISVPAYKLILAGRGEDGVNKATEAAKEGEPFAVAFVDMQMPGINGAETAKRLWVNDPEIRIIIVTAYSEYSPEDIIRTCGRSDIFYLRKPFNPEEIRQFARVLTNEWNIEYERKTLSEQLKTANLKLEEINLELQDRVNKQAAMIVQSEKMASVGILAAGVAHEINNPIAYINGNLSTIQKYCRRITKLHDHYERMETMIIEDNLDGANATLNIIRDFKNEKKIDFILGDINDLADESLDGTERVKNIVRDLQTFSRADQGEFKPVDINETINVTLNILANKLKYKADVKKDFEEIPEVHCFPQKISQVFMNLILNAAQAIKDKGIIKITTSYIEEGKRASDVFVEVKISDTGCGIKEKNITKLFDPFFTTKPVGEGTGLGLSIVYDIIKSHGGDIFVHSEEGKGTTFSIKIPVGAKMQKLDASVKSI